MAKDRVERDEEDLVRLYLSDIGQYTLLTKDDEVRLAKQIEAGKAAATELEALGYSALWIPDVGGDLFTPLAALLGATTTATIATGILRPVGSDIAFIRNSQP